MSEKKFLYEAVIDALELHSSYKLPELRLGNPRKRLIVASGNALPTGRIIFRNEDALFADEGQYKRVLDNNQIDGAVVISASGEKDAPSIVDHLRKDRNIETYLLTCNSNSTAAKLLADLHGHVIVTKSNKELLTYNISTYFGMIIASTGEKPQKIRDHIKEHVNPIIPVNLGGYNSYYIIIPAEYDTVGGMLLTKFDELFGGKVNGRCYVKDTTRHGKTIISSPDEMFISIGFRNELFGHPKSRLDIPLFEGASFGSVMALGYYVIGKIQEQKPAYFAEEIDAYGAYQKEKLFDNDYFHSKLCSFRVG